MENLNIVKIPSPMDITITPTSTTFDLPFQHQTLIQQQPLTQQLTPQLLTPQQPIFPPQQNHQSLLQIPQQLLPPQQQQLLPQQQQQQQQPSPPLINEVPSPTNGSQMVTGKRVQKKTILALPPLPGLCTQCNGKRRHTRTCPYRKREEEDEIMFTSQQIINRLDIAALRRYKRHYRLKTRHNSSKAELANAVKQHYDTMQLNEVETIELFLVKAKSQAS